MLTRVEIKQFRSCHGVVLDNLGPMTVLAGRNAAGKTNILQAIQLAAGFAVSGPVPPEPGSAGGTFRESGISLESRIGTTTYQYTLDGPPDLEELLSTKGASGERQIVFHRNHEGVELPGASAALRIGDAVSCIQALASLLPADHAIAIAMRPFRAFLQRIRYYPLEDGDAGDLRNSHYAPITQADYDEWLSHYRKEAEPGESVLMRLLHAKLAEPDLFGEIRSLLGSNGLGLLDDIRMDRLELTGELVSDLKADRLYLPAFLPSLHPPQSNYLGFANLSAGTQRVIRLIVSLLFDKSSVMLVEHPEDGIHRGLLRKLIGVLQTYSDESQLIVSSHSAVVFNALDADAVRLVTMEKGETKVRALTAQERDAAAKYLEDQGSLSEFLETVEED